MYKFDAVGLHGLGDCVLELDGLGRDGVLRHAHLQARAKWAAVRHGVEVQRACGEASRRTCGEDVCVGGQADVCVGRMCVGGGLAWNASPSISTLTLHLCCGGPPSNAPLAAPPGAAALPAAAPPVCGPLADSGLSAAAPSVPIRSRESRSRLDVGA